MTQFVYTDNPKRDIWIDLSTWENHEVAQQLLVAKYASSPSQPSSGAISSLAQRFTYYLAQSREYFAAAEHVGLATKPILIFYGMLNAAKLLILCRYPTYPGPKDEQHGFGQWSAPNPYIFKDDYVLPTSKGTFPLLHSCLSNTPMTGQKYTLGTLLSFVPELKRRYEQVFPGERSRMIDVRLKAPFGVPLPTAQDRTMQVYIEGSELKRRRIDSLVKAYSRLPGLTTITGFDSFETFLIKDVLVCRWDVTSLETLDHQLIQAFTRGVHGELYLMDTQNMFPVLPEISIYYMLGFALSMICRYHPEVWGAISSPSSATESLIISQFLDLAARKYPNLILNNLLGTTTFYVSGPRVGGTVE